MGQRDSDDDATDVVENNGYSNVGSGPTVDTSSFDMATPAGVERHPSADFVPEAMRVADPTRAEAPKMLSRDKLAHVAVPPPVEEANQRKSLLMAGGLLGLVMVLVVGGAFAMSQTKTAPPAPVVPAAKAPAVPAPPPKPQKIEGVRVREGLQKVPAPAKAGSDGINAVPSGGRVEDAPSSAPPTPAKDADAEGSPGASD